MRHETRAKKQKKQKSTSSILSKQTPKANYKTETKILVESFLCQALKDLRSTKETQNEN